jgi:glutaredoxin
MTMYELYQAEWCPYSHRVRAKLTERGVDFIARQVPAQKSERRAMREKIGADSIPTLVADGRVIDEFEAILAFIDARHPATQDSERHRAKDRDPEEQHERELLRERYP